MHRRSLSFIVTLALVLAAVPLSASQFIDVPFDRVAREATLVVRGTIDNTWSAWDDAHEIIYTYATVKVSRYFGDTNGPATLMVREVGGTVDGYTQEAIGFPAIRSGEEVVLMLSKWEDSADLRIHAFNQGKYMVRNRAGREVITSDPVKQGEARLTHEGGIRAQSVDELPALGLEEFAQMVESARAGRGVDRDGQHRQ
jgi:hypothetical protein